MTKTKKKVLQLTAGLARPGAIDPEQMRQYLNELSELVHFAKSL
jgi:hypothetical protein